MLLTLAIILFVCWILGFLAFHVAGSLIHLVALVALIMLIAHFLRGGRRAA